MPQMGEICGVRSTDRLRPITGQFANKPTHSQSSRGQVNSQTVQLANSKFFNHGKIITYKYTKQQRNTNPNVLLTIDSVHDVIYRKSHSYIHRRVENSGWKDICCLLHPRIWF